MMDTAVQPDEASYGIGQEQNVGIARLQVREWGWRSIFVFGLSSIGLFYSGLLPFSNIAGLWPGADLAGVLTIAFLIALLSTSVYAAIGMAVPYNGADYVLASRLLNAPLAFAFSWTLVAFLAISSGVVIASILQESIPMFARTLFVVFGNRQLLDNIHSFSSPASIVLVGTFGILGVFFLLLLPPWVIKRFLLAGLLLTVASWLVIVFSFVFASGSAFAPAYDAAMGQGSFLNHLLQVRAHGMRTDFGPASMLLAGLVTGSTLFFGCFHATFFAQEVKTQDKTLLRGSGLALLVGWLILVGAAVLVQRLIPLEWLAAESYLAGTSPDGTAAMPWLPFYAAVLQKGLASFCLIGAGVLVASLMLVFTFLYAASRVIQSWAKDGMVPADVGLVHPLLLSPLIAVLIATVLAEAGLVISALGGSLGARVSPAFFMTFIQLFPVLALVVFPFRKRDWFQKAPPTLQRKIGRLPLISLIGGVTFMLLLSGMAAILLFPEKSGMNAVTLAWFFLVFGSGLAWFYVWKSYRAEQGQDVQAIFRNLPDS